MNIFTVNYFSHRMCENEKQKSRAGHISLKNWRRIKLDKNNWNFLCLVLYIQYYNSWRTNSALKVRIRHDPDSKHWRKYFKSRSGVCRKNEVVYMLPVSPPPILFFIHISMIDTTWTNFHQFFTKLLRHGITSFDVKKWIQ